MNKDLKSALFVTLPLAVITSLVVYAAKFSDTEEGRTLLSWLSILGISFGAYFGWLWRVATNRQREDERDMKRFGFSDLSDIVAWRTMNESERFVYEKMTEKGVYSALGNEPFLADLESNELHVMKLKIPADGYVSPFFRFPNGSIVLHPQLRK